MAASCALITIQSQYIKETGRDFSEWQRLLLSVPHESYSRAIEYLEMHGLNKNRAEFLLNACASQLCFTGSK